MILGFVFIFIIEHNIQIHHIPKLLTEKDMINELIPNIGDRLNFIGKYEEFISQKTDNVSSGLIYSNICKTIFHLFIFIYFIMVRIFVSFKWKMMDR